MIPIVPIVLSKSVSGSSVVILVVCSDNIIFNMLTSLLVSQPQPWTLLFLFSLIIMGLKSSGLFIPVLQSFKRIDFEFPL